MANYKRGDVVLVPFPFVISGGMKQKLRPALVVSDHSIDRRFSDLILLAITSQVPDKVLKTEYKVDSSAVYFGHTGLKKTSIIRGELIMTLPQSLVVRRIGELPLGIMAEVDKLLKTSLGLK
jgi:mRNA-degrading endonuclease toxin of MazEF toxin-antitoxin module